MQRTGDQIGAIELARDAHGEREFAGAGREIFDAARGRTAAAHDGESREGLERADQYASGLTLGLAYKIQTFIHAVDEIDVGVAGRTENNARSIGEAAPAVGGAIIDAKICFHLYNAACGRSMHQDFSQAIARDFDGRTSVEIALERR